jgi:hypothetical protein
MKLVKPTKLHFFSFIIVLPLIALAFNWILYRERSFSDWQVYVYSTIIICSIAFVSWYVHILYDYFIIRKFPSLAQTGKRIFYKMLTNFLVMTPSVLIAFFVYDAFDILGYNLRTGDLKWGYVLGLCINFLFVTLWEVFYLLDKYRESLAERDMLEQMGMEQEFENLKSQVNPHFLFNCFNTLSSLIQEDKGEAEKFLDELSKVYRYLLRSNEDGISTVEKEVKFLESYYRLLKTRYRDGLHINIDIDKRYYPYLLPSLSLQLLVENAVKHNVVSKQKPLMIEVFTAAGNKLVVNNNLQRKQINKNSTKIGLNNISSKYKLMKQQGFQVVEGENNFMVVMPLVWNDTKEEVLSK